VDARASLNAVVKRKNPCPFQESNPSYPSSSPVTVLTKLSQLLTVISNDVLFILKIQ
jgi:hypothetical protein